MTLLLIGIGVGFLAYHFLIVKKVWKKDEPPKVRLNRPPTLRKGCE